MPYPQVEWKDYRCTLCGNVESISTSHYGTVYAHCHGCSWKSEGFGPGIRMFGTVHRVFEIADPALREKLSRRNPPGRRNLPEWFGESPDEYESPVGPPQQRRRNSTVNLDTSLRFDIYQPPPGRKKLRDAYGISVHCPRGSYLRDLGSSHSGLCKLRIGYDGVGWRLDVYDWLFGTWNALGPDQFESPEAAARSLEDMLRSDGCAP